ncbi:MAG: alpha-2-macroglobulin [Pseudomonadota bacterium]
MRALMLLIALAFALPAGAFELPGLESDTAAYRAELRNRFPAANPQARAAAEARAIQAERQNNIPAAIAAWEERLASGPLPPEGWMTLARLQLARRPPDAARALMAAWVAFTIVPAGPPEIPSLLMMADALRVLNRQAQMLEAIAAAAERAPTDAALLARLATTRREVGLLPARLRTEPESEPARACVAFTLPPARRQDWTPGNWVRADPPIPDLAVVREGDELCVAGLPWGRTTRLTFRPGMPGEDGTSLVNAQVLPVSMPNRTPRLAFDQRNHILPRGQEPRITLGSTNVSAVSIRLIRVAERNLVGLRQSWQPGQAMESYTAENLAEETGTLLWEGRADIPRFEVNRTQRTALPLPDILRTAPPGLFVLALRSGDGNARNEARATLPIIITDIGLVAWRGADGVAVQARALGSALAKPGIRVALMARNNEVLGEAVTDEAGLARFAAPLLRGRAGLAPVALHATDGTDFASLDLDAAAFDLSDRGATGRAHPAALDAFVWLDRGIYRPGETVQIAALLRDTAGAPVDLPVRLRVRRPSGQIFAEMTPERAPGGALLWPMTLSRGAPAGAWSIEALSDPDAPPIGRASFRVDAFVPERLAVEATPPAGQLVPGQLMPVPVTARFLYGAPGSGLTGNAQFMLAVNPTPFPDWAGWRIGLTDETFAPSLQTIELPQTDADGRTTLPLLLRNAPDSTRVLQADVAVFVSEPGGAESRAQFTIPVRPSGRLIALRPAFSGEAIDDNAEAGFEFVALTPEGAAAPARLRIRLVRERPNWRLVTRGSVARYETVWRDEVVDSTEADFTPGTPIRFARRLPFGRYRIEAADATGLGITSMRFRAGWAASENAETPDRIDVSTDRQSFADGATARVRVVPPFAGRASVAILTDRLVSLREIEIPAAGTEIEVPVSAAWGPGAYVAVSLYRAGEERRGPGRALGLAWIALDPSLRRLEVSIDTPERITPRQRLMVPVRVASAGGAAHLTLAAIDEGILSLTRFASPDPVGHFLGRRRLGTDIRDDYGRLIAPAEGEATALRQGGDDGDPTGLVRIPTRIVTLFSGIVETDANGQAMVPLDIPDFAGELRLMAVAWEGARVGAASRPLTIRDPVVAEAILPRFLAPGDEAMLPVLLHNLDLPAGPITATLTTEGPLALAGPATLTANLATGARAQPATVLRATGAGEGTLRLAVTGPGGFSVTRESQITLRSSRPLAVESASGSIPAGQGATLTPDTARFLPGTWRATVSLGAATRYDAAPLIAALSTGFCPCTDQVASAILALSYAPDAPDRAGALQRAVEGLLDRQRFDGSFGVYSAQGESQTWLTLFATEALLRARAGGIGIPEQAIENALRHIEDLLDDTTEDNAERRADQAYRVHVLALAGRYRLGAARRLLESINDLPTPLSRAQLGAAFARAGDQPRAEAAFAAALAAPERRWWRHDFGSQVRDALAVAALLKESGLMEDRLTALIARLPVNLSPLTTNAQEQGWAVAAAGILSGGSRPVRATLDGAAVAERPVIRAALTGPAQIRNLGDVPLAQSVSVTGIPVQPYPAGRSGLRILRRFVNLDGSTVNLDQHRQGHGFVVVLEARADSQEEHRVLLQQGLPAGWEITARLGPGTVPGLPWLEALSPTETQPALDDRFEVVAVVSPQQPLLRVAFRIRATTPGVFELPGGEVIDTGRPAFFARQNTNRITVQTAQ